MRNILNGYKNFYKSSIAFGMRKKLTPIKKNLKCLPYRLEINNSIFGKIDWRIIK